MPTNNMDHIHDRGTDRPLNDSRIGGGKTNSSPFFTLCKLTDGTTALAFSETEVYKLASMELDFSDKKNTPLASPTIFQGRSSYVRPRSKLTLNGKDHYDSDFDYYLIIPRENLPKGNGTQLIVVSITTYYGHGAGPGYGPSSPMDFYQVTVKFAITVPQYSNSEALISGYALIQGTATTSDSVPAGYNGLSYNGGTTSFDPALFNQWVSSPNNVPYQAKYSPPIDFFTPTAIYNTYDLYIDPSYLPLSS